MADHHVRVELFAAVYPNTFEARATLNDLVKMHKEGTVELVDAAVMVRERSGRLRIHEWAEITPRRGAKRGALVGAVIGVIFPPSLLATVFIGAAAGAVTGKVTDQGFENEMLREIADELDAGKSAILAAVEHHWYSETMKAVVGYERIVERSLHADAFGSITLRS